MVFTKKGDKDITNNTLDCTYMSHFERQLKTIEGIPKSSMNFFMGVKFF